ncbi:MAG: cytochrome c [Nitrospiraceae bacterium]|nr:cytochrome c [Nitrospiraceae bacterium]
MKALMSVGAVVGVIASLVLLGMIFGVIPASTVHLVEGYMPMQMLFELSIFVAGFTGLSYMLNSMGMTIPRFWQGIGFVAFILFYLKSRIYPPIPFSVRAMYGTVTMVAVFMWMSSNEEDWKKFRQPILNVMDGLTPLHKGLRTFFLIAIPLGLWGFAYQSFVPQGAGADVDEPIELRTVHPAPPASTKVHGKTFVLQTSQNPYRANPEGKYDQEYSNKLIVEQSMGRLMQENANPWDPKAEGYLKNVREGGEIFFQNCHFCHGDNLNGRGLHAFAFNPIPANFTDPGTIAQLQETFIFWRVSKGGLGLPREGFPWASVMPPWEQHLTTDEIWKVVLFEYWHTGYYPRTWD